MTTPMIPDYIITLYENEIRKVVRSVLTVVSEDYNLNLKELEAKASNIIRLELIPEEFENISITKKKGNIKIDDANRCIARMKKNGIFVQCTRTGKPNQMCKTHSKKHAFGTINDPLPEEPTSRSRKCLH